VSSKLYIKVDDGSGGVALSGIEGKIRGHNDRKRERDLK